MRFGHWIATGRVKTMSDERQTDLEDYVSLEQQIDETAKHLVDQVGVLAQGIATSLRLPAATVHAKLVAAIGSLLQPESAAVLNDGRTVQWRTRIRWYAKGQSDPTEDTDQDLPQDQPGSQIISGLPNVARYLEICTVNIHAPNGESVTGVEAETLAHRLKSLRPTLSRNQGKATWRVPYVAHHLHGADNEWVARVDVERVNNGSQS